MRIVRLSAVLIIVTLAAAATAALAGAAQPVRAQRNAITVTTPSRVQQGTVYDVTVTGYARQRSIAYLFVDYAPCAVSLAAERARATPESDSYRVRGSFAETSGWKSPATGLDHACAYLVSPSSGSVLASARQSYRVRG